MSYAQEREFTRAERSLRVWHLICERHKKGLPGPTIKECMAVSGASVSAVYLIVRDIERAIGKVRREAGRVEYCEWNE